MLALVTRDFMAKTKIKSDSRGLYLRTRGYLFRPVPNDQYGVNDPKVIKHSTICPVCVNTIHAFSLFQKGRQTPPKTHSNKGK
jgi:hypothetical protein